MKFLKSVLIFISVWSVFYVIGIIIALDFNVMNWNLYGRIAFAIFGMFFSLFALLVHHFFKR